MLDRREQRPLLDDFTAALHEGAPVAVLDPGWPRRLLDTARAELAEAARQGRVGAGRLVLFTSGSGGGPRGVVRTHASWRASLAPLTDLLGLTGADVVWTPGPMWSSLSLYAAWHATTVGAATVLAGEDPSAATVVHTVPSALPRLRRLAAGGGLAVLRTVVLAGEPVQESHRAACAAAGWRVAEYYGAAELSFVGWSGDGRPWTPFPGAEVELRRGRVWVRSPYLAEGYLDDRPGALCRDGGGWAGVGDLAVASGGGFTVTGRGTGAISTGGHTVLAEHVEAVLLRVAGVEGVLVVGRPHPDLGEVVTALVVGAAGAAALRAAVDGLPASSRPRRWGRVTELPRTSSGKPDRAGARARVADGTIATGALT